MEKVSTFASPHIRIPNEAHLLVRSQQISALMGELISGISLSQTPFQTELHNVNSAHAWFGKPSPVARILRVR